MEFMEALDLIQKELRKVRKEHRPFASPHEGIAMIQEEVNELWAAVHDLKSFSDKTVNEKLKHEAVQVATMAIRFLTDVCE